MNVEDVGADIGDEVIRSVRSGFESVVPVKVIPAGADIDDVVFVLSGNVNSDPVNDSVAGADI